MRFAFVVGNRVSRFVSMNKLAKALAILRPEGDFTEHDFFGSDNQEIRGSDYQNFLKLYFDACRSLDSAYNG